MSEQWAFRRQIGFKKPQPLVTHELAPRDFINIAKQAGTIIKDDEVKFLLTGTGGADYQIDLVVDDRSYKITGNMFEGVATTTRVFEDE